MHEKARRWDLDRGINTSWPNGKDEDKIPIPENRPCDLCGESVKKGYIHSKCVGKEQDLWLDILY